MTEPAPFPGAHAPDRTRRVDSSGVGIAVNEWGDPAAPPLLLVHGGFDFSRTFDVFAPLLAAGGWRVVAFDQRGHGDSDHAALYSWDADVRDAVAVMESTAPGPMPVVGHSKGGNLMTQLADAGPHLISHLVNLDGLPSKRQPPDVADHERTKLLAADISAWLEHRRRSATGQRKPGTIEELAARRARMNPRLSPEWLRRLVTVGARQDSDGWRWKIDPALRFGGFGPWRAEWSLQGLRGLAMPFMGVLGLVQEEMGWGTVPDDVRPYLPLGSRFEVLEDVGHFVHIEQPEKVAGMVLEFLS
ncbi:MAG TPA: alpha/beta hydrolase [Acidimicrobiales bacterium]|nr:alpha/beta hydrolase [Acidimicrobiales bacterium]